MTTRVSRVEQGQDLLVPGAAAERVPVDQHDGLAGAMVFIVDFDVGGVLPADGDFGHGVSLPLAGMAGARSSSMS